MPSPRVRVRPRPESRRQSTTTSGTPAALRASLSRPACALRRSRSSTPDRTLNPEKEDFRRRPQLRKLDTRFYILICLKSPNSGKYHYDTVCAVSNLPLTQKSSPLPSQASKRPAGINIIIKLLYYCTSVVKGGFPFNFGGPSRFFLLGGPSRCSFFFPFWGPFPGVRWPNQNRIGSEAVRSPDHATFWRFLWFRTRSYACAAAAHAPTAASAPT